MPRIVHSSRKIVLRSLFMVHGKIKTVNRQRTKNNLPGFSLIEVVLSMFVILALISILFAASGTYRHSRNSQLQTIATKIASRKIEILRKTDYTAIPDLGTSSFSDSDLAKLPASTANLTVADYPPSCSPTCSSDIKQITVTVNWTEGGVVKTISEDTIISKNGL